MVTVDISVTLVHPVLLNTLRTLKKSAEVNNVSCSTLSCYIVFRFRFD